jgi:hypothetical protein
MPDLESVSGLGWRIVCLVPGELGKWGYFGVYLGSFSRKSGLGTNKNKKFMFFKRNFAGL